MAQGGLGILDQNLRRFGIGRKQRYADAGGQENVFSVCAERRFESGKDTPDGDFRPDVRFDIGQKGCEPVGVDVGHGIVAPYRGTQSVGAVANDGLGRRRSEGVPDRLKMVEIHQKHRAGLAFPLCVGDGLVQTIKNQKPVGQAPVTAS